MANTQFQLEGNAAQIYERDSVPIFGSPLAESTFEHVSLHDGDRILDVACGTGIVARVAVERFGNIANAVGVDLNPNMLAVARENMPTMDISIEWRQGDMYALPFPDGRFDVVLCQNGLQYAPDKLAALRELRRVLVPGGRLAFTVWSDVSPYNAALAEALTRHVSAEAATSCLSAYAWSETAMIRQVLDDAGFSAIDMQLLVITVRIPSSPEAVVDGMARTAFARDVAAVPETVRRTIGQEVCAALHAYRDGDDFVYSQASHLVQAQVS